MSYETENCLPNAVTVRDVIEFAELLGFRRNGNYGHLGRPDVIAMHHFEERDYRSWEPIELSIWPEDLGLAVGTRTRVGRSAYDFKKQNATGRAIKKRFGGKYSTDGQGYDPGPPMPPSPPV